MNFLVVDPRFGTPIYVFLEADPHDEPGYPGLKVHEITLAPLLDGQCGNRTAIGRDPAHLEQFQEFASDGAVRRAGFILVEPRFVGADWEGYCRHFRPEGEKPAKRLAARPYGVKNG